LAYEINKKTEGIYAVINVNANSADVLEVDRQLRLSEAVMRTKVLRADEAVVNIEPVVVPEVSAEEKAADTVEEAPAKAPAAEKPVAAKAPAAKKAPAEKPVVEKAPATKKAPAAKKPAAKKAE
jgi:small subunit ribosomal protein S6